MNALTVLNYTVRFLLEISMLAAVGYWGFQTQSSWLLKILLGIGLPVSIAVLWGLFIAPKATHPLQGVPRLALELLLFASGAAALFASGKPGLGWVYTVAVIVNEVLLAVGKE